MDATRAFALLLGVVFHTVWFYTESPYGTPVKDVGAGPFFSWFFDTSHSFRMQLFFVIAGFFARLVYLRRGLREFVRNRFFRIVVPFVVGWLILYPLLVTTWVWGQGKSGQLALPISPWLVGIGSMLPPGIFIPRSAGGSFGLAHLWFLYYLLLTYVIVLVLRAGLRPVGARVAAVGDRCFQIVAGSPLGALLLAALMCPLLVFMNGWSVDTPAYSYVPHPLVAALYSSFFVFGWFLHRRADQLGTLFRPWRLYLTAGLLVSVAAFALKQKARPDDAHLPPHAVRYSDVEDWNGFLESLRQIGRAEEREVAARQLWAAFPEHVRDTIAAEEPLFDQRYGLLSEINRILADPAYRTDEFETRLKFHTRRPGDPAVIGENRAALLPALRGVTMKDSRLEASYAGAKARHAALYSLMMVLLVYGSLGAFQALVVGASPVWRYLADSSYWVYLVHLPLVPAIEILVYRLPCPGWIKCPLVCLAALLVLYASYHYLVRSTIIGRTLNGRKHPFHWNPVKSLQSIE